MNFSISFKICRNSLGPNFVTWWCARRHVFLTDWRPKPPEQQYYVIIDHRFQIWGLPLRLLGGHIKSGCTSKSLKQFLQEGWNTPKRSNSNSPAVFLQCLLQIYTWAVLWAHSFFDLQCLLIFPVISNDIDRTMMWWLHYRGKAKLTHQSIGPCPTWD